MMHPPAISAAQSLSATAPVINASTAETQWAALKRIVKLCVLFLLFLTLCFSLVNREVWIIEETGSNQAQVQMQPQIFEKPASVTVFGVLNCVFGGMGVLCTPFNIFGLFMAGRTIEIVWGFKVYLLASSALGIGFSAWLLALGIGLLKFKGWARRGSVIYSIIAIVWGIASAGLSVVALSLGWMSAPQGQMPAMVGGMCGGMIGLIYPVLLLIFMQTQKVKRAFAAIGG
jgi:hypothetical protein